MLVSEVIKKLQERINKYGDEELKIFEFNESNIKKILKIDIEEE